MILRKLAIPCLGLLAGVMITPARASSVSVGFGIGPDATTPCSQTTTGTTAAVCNYISADGTFLASATGFASDGYFISNTFLQYTVGNDTYSFVGGSDQADAQLQDTLFLSNAPTSGFLQFNFYMTGTFIQDSDSNPSVYITLGATANVDGTGGDALFWNTNEIYPPPYSVNIPYSDLSPSITCDVYSDTGAAIATDPNITTYTGEVAFSGVVQILVLDPNQQIVPGAVIGSASGYNYASTEPTPAGHGVAAGASLRRIRLFETKGPVRK